MASELTQVEAEELLRLGKHFEDEATVTLPPGSNTSHALVAHVSHEHFLLDLWRGSIRLSKARYQTRVRTTVVLARLDIDAAPHTNPDGERIEGTHLHVYREGYEARWAMPVDPADFPNPRDLEQALRDFCRYCSIEQPTIQGTLR